MFRPSSEELAWWSPNPTTTTLPTEMTRDPVDYAQSGPQQQLAGQRAYACGVCDRNFEQPTQLLRHLRVHKSVEQGRVHQCTECNKSFNQSGQLMVHMRCHSSAGEKPYVCTSCHQVLPSAAQLKIHLRSHAATEAATVVPASAVALREERPHTCNLCGKSFAYSHVLKLHQVKHYACRVYRCNICRHTFDSRRVMEAHVMSHEKDSAAAAHIPRRPSSTGSASSISDKSDSSPTPPPPASAAGSPATIRPAAATQPTVRPFFPVSCTTLPSVHLLAVDEEEMRRISQVRQSVVRPNPMYAVTDRMIKQLMEEDYKQFGSLPVLRSPPMSHLTAAAVTSAKAADDTNSVTSQDEPMNLSIKDSASPAPSTISSCSPAPSTMRTPSPPTFSGMSRSSLPPNKRHRVLA